MATRDTNRGPEFLAIFVTGTTIAAITVLLRLWVRTRIVRKVGADDWIMAISMILVFVSLGLISAAVHHGLGRHTSFLSPEQAQNASRFLWIAICFTPSAEATAKISITLMLIRITTSAQWKRFFYSLIILFIMITIASLFAVVLSCVPIDLLWGSQIDGHCNVLERTVVLYFQGVMAAGYDIILAIAPIFLLWNVQISRQSKIFLCGLLGLGFFTSAAGIVRVVHTDESAQRYDATYGIITVMIWKCIELPLSIIVGCLPTLRPLLYKSTHYEESPHRMQDTSNLYGQSEGNQIKKTTSINLDIGSLSSDEPQLQYGWEVEERV